MSKRSKMRHHNWHHRKPRSLGGKTDDANMVQVSVSKHQAWHTLFKNYDPFEICDLINAIWLDPAFKFEVKRVVNPK